MPTGRDIDQLEAAGTDVGSGPHVFDHRVSTAPDSGGHHSPAVLVVQIVGQQLGHGIPVARRESRLKSLAYTSCGVV